MTRLPAEALRAIVEANGGKVVSNKTFEVAETAMPGAVKALNDLGYKCDAAPGNSRRIESDPLRPGRTHTVYQIQVERKPDQDEYRPREIGGRYKRLGGGDL